MLGDTHPDTLTSRNNLAYAYWEVADLGRAVSLYEVTLAQCERVLGNAHPDTRRSRNNLARVKADIEEAAASPDPSKGSYAAMNSDEPDAQPAAGATPIGHETPVPPIPQ